MIVGSISRHECLSRSVMKVLGFLTYSIMTLVLKTALDASQTWALITYKLLSVHA
jgi:hypothetical protein